MQHAAAAMAPIASRSSALRTTGNLHDRLDSGAKHVRVTPVLAVLGPVGWWWDTIYYGLFDGNTALMYLFGWELFVSPIFGTIGLLVTVAVAIYEGVVGH